MSDEIKAGNYAEGPVSAAEMTSLEPSSYTKANSSLATDHCLFNVLRRKLVT